jgi:hypothetical protein
LGFLTKPELIKSWNKYVDFNIDYLFIFLHKVMTDQQRELFQTMDQQQKVQFIQRLKQEREMKMRQEQMQMQAAGGPPAGGPPQQFPQQQVIVQ